MERNWGIIFAVSFLYEFIYSIFMSIKIDIYKIKIKKECDIYCLFGKCILEW